MAPTLLTDWTGQDVAGWYVSEKLDGWRCLWDGSQYWTRQGNLYHAPAAWYVGMPTAPLDGELYTGTRDRYALQGCIQSGRWEHIRFHVFDAIMPGRFVDRLATVQSLTLPDHVRLVPQRMLRSTAEFKDAARAIISAGGEGAVARNPSAEYRPCRTTDVLRIKSAD